MAFTPTLQGKVTNGVGTDQEGLTVKLFTATNYEAGGATTATTTTDNDGLWIFTNQTDAVYIVEVTNADGSEKILFDGRNSVQFAKVHITGILDVHRPRPSSGFLAYNSASNDNVTGNGATPTVEFDTEVFDQGLEYNITNDTFTPVTAAFYSLATAVQYSGGTGVTGTITLKINTSNRVYSHVMVWTTNVPSLVTTVLSIPSADMDASDTVTVTLRVQGEASDLLDIKGEAAATTWFAGMMVG